MKTFIRIGVFALLTAVLIACSGVGSTGSVANFEFMSAPDTVEQEAPAGLPEPTEVICPEVSPHPVAADIAGTFDVNHEQVEDWFCSGVPFDEILLALQTQKLIDVNIEQLFDERKEGKSWDQIWNELGVTGPR